MRTGFFRRLMSAATLILSTLFVSGPVFAGEFYLSVRRASDIPKVFDSKKPLYVKGEVPPGSSPWSEAQLENFGKQLANINGSRRQKVGVLLLEHFNDESFRVENVTYSGEYKAVQAMVEIGLKSNSAFMQEDWAWICICFQQSSAFGGERPFEYWPSKQLKDWRLGVGEIWEGDLKVFMLKRLKARNIPNAFLDTATELNDRLDRYIQAELDRKAELKRQGVATLRTAEERHALLLANLAKLKAANPTVQGEVFNPDLSASTANLENARAAVAQENYARAKEAGDKVVAFAATHQKLLDEFPGTPAILAGLTKRVSDLKEHPFAGSASEEFSTANAGINAATQAHRSGDLNFVDLRTNASSQVDQIQSAVESAQFKYRAFVTTVTLVALGILAGIAVVLVLLRRWSQSAKQSFEELYSSRLNMLKEKRTAQQALQRKKTDVIGATKAESAIFSEADKKENQTSRAADKAGTLVGDVFIMLACADEVLREAIKKATPSNLLERISFAFSAKPWQAAENYLSTTPIKFNKKSGLRFALSADKTSSATEALWKDLSEFDDFEMSFIELNEKLSSKSKEADSLLDQIDQALKQIGPILTRACVTLHGSAADDKHSLDARYNAACAVWNDDGRFVVNGYSDKLVPVLDTEIARLTKLGKQDPVRAYAETPFLVKCVTSTTQLIEQIEAVAGTYGKISDGYHALNERKIKAEWLKERYNAILSRLDQQLVLVTTGRRPDSFQEFELVTTEASLPAKGDAKLNMLVAALQASALTRLVKDVAKLAENLRDRLDAGLEASVTKIGSTRVSISASIGKIEASKILVEHDKERKLDLNPDTYLASGRRYLETCVEELGEGDLAAAQKAYDRGMESLNQANEIVAATIKAHEGYAGRVEAIGLRADELDSQVSSHQAILEGIREQFDKAVLLLTAEDAAASDENGTIADNFLEIEKAAELREEHLGRASALRSQGKLLEAAAILAAAEAANEFFEHRLQGVAKKRERLDRTVAENTKKREELEKTLGTLGKATADPRVMSTTTAQYDNACAQFKKAQALFAAEKPNPFKIEAALLEVQQAFWSVDERIKLDLELHLEADNSLKAARKRVAQAEAAARRVTGMADDIPDSDRLAKVPKEIKALEKKLARAEELFQVESGNWDEVNELADSITEEAQSLLDIINVEAENGRSTVDAISKAAKTVREAVNWAGSYGVSLMGRPGSDLLERARKALELGQYQEARRLAESALKKAASAIAEAEAEVARKRREEEERRRRQREKEEREEEERRRRMRSSSSSSSSSGGFGGFSSSGGGGGFGGFSSGGGSSSFGGFSSSGGSGGW